MLLVTPLMVVPSAESSPASFHDCVLGNSKLIRPSFSVKRLSGLSIFCSFTWMGWSNGRWDGDTLVIEVKGFDDLSWFDRAGNHHSEALTVTERYGPAPGGSPGARGPASRA